MTNPSIESFFARRARQTGLSTRPRLVLLEFSPGSKPQVEFPMIDQEPLDMSANLDFSIASKDVDPDDVEGLLAELAAQYDRNQADIMWQRCRDETLRAVVVGLGLGRVVAVLDKVGGNVNTIHNARAGVYATEDGRTSYEQRGEYDKKISAKYHQHKNYIATGEKNLASLKEGTLVDDYTGESFHLSDHKNDQTKPTIDHIVAAEKVHNDPGRILAGIDGIDLANKPSNLATTSKTINSTKNSKTATKFGEYLEDKASERLERIAELEAKSGTLADQERKQLAKLREQEKVDPMRVTEKEAVAQAEIDREINRKYYTSIKFTGTVARTCTVEGVKIGVQQAFGEVLVEFFAAVFDEINDWSKNRRSETTLLKELKARLIKVAHRCEKKLQAALDAFKQGSISGFFSNLVTTLINVFVTTGQRLVRMFREGIFSLLRALKILLNPPEGLTFQEAAHEASKILFAGVVVVGAIPVEEWLEKQLVLIPLLTGIAPAASNAIVGGLTALITSFGIYLIEQADLFGVVQERRLDGVHGLLDASIEKREQHLEDLLRVESFGGLRAIHR